MNACARPDVNNLVETTPSKRRLAVLYLQVDLARFALFKLLNMGKKIKLAALAILVAVVAYIYPTAKQKYVKHVKPKVEQGFLL